MKRLDVLVDMDGILCDFLTPWIDAVNAGMPIGWTGPGGPPRPNLSVRDVTDYDIFKLVPEANREWARGIFLRRGFYRDLRPIAGAYETLRRLHEDGHRVHVVTSPMGADCIAEKMEWLERHMAFLPRENTFFCWRKELVRGDVLVDDRPETLEAWREAWQDGIATGIRWPYNNGHGLEESWEDEAGAWAAIKAKVSAYADGR
jgi:5'(3')-deoxyribonucleotidase